MTEKRFTLVKCYNEQWGVVDKSLEELDQLVLITTSKSGTGYLVSELNELNDENEQLKQTIETQNFNYKNAKGIIHSSEHRIQRLQDENEQLECKIKLLQNEVDMLNGKGIEFKSITDLKNKYHNGDDLNG